MRTTYQNENATFAEMVRELRKPGRVFVAMIGRDDVRHVQAVKADLIGQFSHAHLADETTGQSLVRFENGDLWIDRA